MLYTIPVFCIEFWDVGGKIVFLLCKRRFALFENKVVFQTVGYGFQAIQSIRFNFKKLASLLKF